MSRTPETEQFRHFERTGVFVNVEPDGKVNIELQGSEGRFSLTKFIEDEFDFEVNASAPSDKYGSVGFKTRTIWINLEDIHTPEMLMLIIAHEMGHVALHDELSKEVFSKRWLIGQVVEEATSHQREPFDQEYRRKLSQLMGLIEEVEREAWEWALKFLMRLQQQYGWDIRQTPGFSREQFKMAVTQATYLQKVPQAFQEAQHDTKRMLHDKYEDSHQEQLQNIIRESFNPKFLELMIDQFWES